MSTTFREVERLLRARYRSACELRPDTSLVADLELDSLLQLDLLVELENHFAVALELDEDQEVITLADLVAWIERAQAQEGAG